MISYSPKDYYNYRIRRAKETLLEVDILIQNKFWNTAIKQDRNLGNCLLKLEKLTKNLESTIPNYLRKDRKEIIQISLIMMKKQLSNFFHYQKN